MVTLKNAEAIAIQERSDLPDDLLKKIDDWITSSKESGHWDTMDILYDAAIRDKETHQPLNLINPSPHDDLNLEFD